MGFNSAFKGLIALVMLSVKHTYREFYIFVQLLSILCVVKVVSLNSHAIVCVNLKPLSEDIIF